MTRRWLIAMLLAIQQHSNCGPTPKGGGTTIFALQIIAKMVYDRYGLAG